MSNGKISPEENLLICEYIREGVLAGEGDDDLTKRRKWLSERLNRSVPTISAISAHLKIRAQNLFKGIIEPEEADRIRDSLNGIGGMERDAKQIHIAQSFGLSSEVIDAIANGVLPEIEKSDEGVSGEHADYNNEIKIKWRTALSEFIEKNSTLEQRRKMRVLCLPGKKCLEIPMYLNLGFQPENIVGVEGGDKLARVEFEWNANKFNIDYRIGILEDLLKDEKSFDVVSLDFHGYMSKANFEITQKIPLAKKAIVMINSLARRESQQAQHLYLHQMQNAFHRSKTKEWRKKLETKRLRMLDDYVRGKISELPPQAYLMQEILEEDHKTLQLDTDPALSMEDTSLDEMRNVLCPSLYNIGFAHPNKMRYPERLHAITSDLSEQTGCEANLLLTVRLMGEKLKFILQELISALVQSERMDLPASIEDLNFIDSFEHIFHDVILNYPYFTNIRKLSYLSGTKSQSMYITDMAALEVPMDIYNQVQATPEFLFSCLEKAIRMESEDKNAWIDSNMAVFLYSGSKKNIKNRPLPPCDCVALIDKNQKPLVFMPLKRFMSDMKNYHKNISRRYPSDPWDMMFNTPREKL